MIVDRNIYKATVHILLGILVVLMIITGLGMVYYQIISYLTLGFLTRSLAFYIHTNLIIPFVIVLVLHSFMSLIFKKKSH